MNGLTQEIYEQIYNVFDGLESNSFETLGKPEVCMFEKPLIGVAAGDDPYYDFLKEHIGEFHWLPAEVFALKYGQGTDPSSLRVICMIFPQTEETKNMQNHAKVFPCDNWVVSRREWESIAFWCFKMVDFNVPWFDDFHRKVMTFASQLYGQKAAIHPHHTSVPW